MVRAGTYWDEISNIVVVKNIKIVWHMKNMTV